MSILKLKSIKHFFILFTFIIFSCSENNVNEEISSQESSYVIVNNIKAKTGIIDNSAPYATKKNGVFSIIFSCGVNSLKHYFDVQITEEGKVVFIKDHSISASYYNRDYYNYRYYPDNFVNVLEFSFNNELKTFKLKLKANLYIDSSNLQSENIDTEMYLLGSYEIKPNTENFLLSDRLDYCSAKFNTNIWTAMKQYENGSFTNYDPYKIKVIFNSSTPVGIYSFTNIENSNCIKFYKFNVLTFQYDEFNVSGNVNMYYKEFHGMSPGLTTYSFFGTFNLTATNPNNPNEVINVTDGKFRTLNPYQ